MNEECSAGRRKYVINTNFLGILLLPVYCYSKAVTIATAIIIVHLINLRGETTTVFAGK